LSSAYRDKLYPLCERLVQTALEIAGQCKLTVTEQGLAHPKLLALALLCRTLTNFKGVVILTRERLVVEARVLTRCCYENMFMVGGLSAEGDAFAERMKADDRAGRSNRLKFQFETESLFETLSAETQTAVTAAYNALTNRQTRKFLNPKEASGIGQFKEAYVAYAQYSGSAAHPTLTALARHWSPLDEKTAAFDAIPEPSEDQLDETLHLACIALLSIMVVVNEMNGFTEAGKKSIKLNIELKTLQAERWGAGEIGGDGMEIRTQEPDR
jgi:Family of unknown function (DUF5677)